MHVPNFSKNRSNHSPFSLLINLLRIKQYYLRAFRMNDFMNNCIFLRIHTGCRNYLGAMNRPPECLFLKKKAVWKSLCIFELCRGRVLSCLDLL